jgi:nucleotide-binding universal stress UspA family protein
VVALHVLHVPLYGAPGLPIAPMPPLTDVQKAELRDTAERDWCKPLADAGVDYRIALVEGVPAQSLIERAQAENAAFVVVGKRGRGGFAELLLGSTSRMLTHHADRPIVIVP